jgi:CMP/dCMP kinase
MIITIDGPAGTGKSSVSQEVARRLGYDFLDTGAMYRAIALAALRAKVSFEDMQALGSLAAGVRVSFDFAATPPRVHLNCEDIAELIRTEEVSSGASKIAVCPAVREAMVRLQQEIGRLRPDLVTEGRDQGTVVFPRAGLKIYLDATPEERARRRKLQLEAKGQAVDFDQLLAQIRERDARDSGRVHSPLAAAADARRLDTTGLSQEQVTQLIVDLAKSAKRSELP